MSKVVIYIYQVIYFLHYLKIPIIPDVLNFIILRILFSCSIKTGAKIGKGSSVGLAGLGVAIHKRAVIGKNTIIGQGVTIGGRSKHNDVPIIGDNCFISPGAKILGPIKIGNNSIVGPNAVVIDDIPDNCIVVGIPAKIIKTDIDIKEYI